MNKLRQSFRRKKDVYVPESSRPHQWQTDEEAVRGGKCSFAVKVMNSHLQLSVIFRSFEDSLSCSAATVLCLNTRILTLSLSV